MESYTARELLWPADTGDERRRQNAGDRVQRFRERAAEYVWNELRLEGLDLTLEDVQAAVAERRSDLPLELARRVYALSKAFNLSLSWLSKHRIRVDIEHTARLNALISEAEDVLEPGVIRGRGSVGGGGHVSGPGFRYSAPGAGLELEEFLASHLERLYLIRNVPLKAAVFAALIAYAQPFPDGNKRTGRLIMNAILLVNGFDGIVVPVFREPEYVAAVAEMYRTADATPYVEFLLACRG